MTQTIIGIFKNHTEAAKAREALTQAGLENEQIRISNYTDDSTEPVTDGQLTDTSETAVTTHRRAAREAMISVEISDSDKMKIATDILYVHGASNVNEFVKQES